jgi:hypothetical protein
MQGMAAARLSPGLLQILHTTLREVEMQEPEGDAVLRDLKQSIVRAISELEVERDGAARRIALSRDSGDGSDRS